MILDASAIVAIATQEPGCLELIQKLDAAATVWIGAPTLVETGLVLRTKRGREFRALLDRFLIDWQVTVLPFGEQHWQAALEAHATYGRGQHKAALNFGDCLTYATAKLADLPLLCTGADFSKIDLAIA